MHGGTSIPRLFYFEETADGVNPFEGSPPLRNFPTRPSVVRHHLSEAGSSTGRTRLGRVRSLETPTLTGPRSVSWSQGGDGPS